MIMDRREKVRQRDQAASDRHRARKRWHPWFAWRPVEIEWGKGQWVWLQWIERKRYENTTYSATGGIFGGPTSSTSTGWDYCLK